jgi:sterol desaturase/sphingolipid hydroxylase (fatty acid hydroxylase superfamily)
LTVCAPRGCDGVCVAQSIFCMARNPSRSRPEPGAAEPVQPPRVEVPATDEETTMSLSTLLIIVLILLLIGALPSWGYSRTWGYRPVGGLGLILIIVIVLLLLGVI